MQKADENDVVAPDGAAPRVNVADPIFFWIMVLVLALVVRVLLADTSVFGVGTEAYSLANSASTFLLFGVGSLILPLVVGAAIGADVGRLSDSSADAMRGGLINGLYSAIIYIIAIIILFEVATYMLPQAVLGSISLTTQFLVESLIIPQVIVLLVVIEAFAMLSHWRKVGG